ncbi:hypothetical protein CW304_25785 [Bacillus sp. UFRGS-B20]|nr:hypothetical protein CW304_25785 [Bacillus sp. UFRGS-B20]
MYSWYTKLSFISKLHEMTTWVSSRMLYFFQLHDSKVSCSCGASAIWCTLFIKAFCTCFNSLQAIFGLD